MHYLYLALAIAAEVVGTTLLRSTEGFTRWLPSAIVMISYGSAFYFLSLCLNKIPVGVAYAIWSGVGTVLIALLGFFVHQQRLDFGAAFGMALIVGGVAIMHYFSRTTVLGEP